jgi:hypothetical protein
MISTPADPWHHWIEESTDEMLRDAVEATAEALSVEPPRTDPCALS